MADPQKTTALERLPDELLLSIAKNLESAREVCSLASTSKNLKRRVDSSTVWQDFVRSKFPLLSIPPRNSDHDWKDLAGALTYQSRCWDRRSIRFTGMFAPQHTRNRGLTFQPIIATDYDMDTDQEIVVWGAGEDIVARYRQRRGLQVQESRASWRQLLGGKHGFRAGVDDVMTMDIVKLPHLKAPAMLAGRESGSFSLMSLQPDQSFGQQLATFSPRRDPSIRQSTIMSVDVLNDNSEGLVAACTNLGVAIYHLPSDNNTSAIPPIMLYDVLANTKQQVYNAKWMGRSDLLALADRGLHDPLRYLAITPTGWRVEAAAKNTRVVEQFDLKPGRILATSLQPVQRFPGRTGPTPLLLSAWRDGSIRLQDIRTPSPFDVVYQDNVQPYSEMGNLMPYGANHFVAGDIQGALIKIFDFRCPRAYYHTTALPCDREYPFRAVEQQFIPPPVDKTNGRACCDHLGGLRCRWHELSREVFHRPNAMFMLSQSMPRTGSPRHVTSLAKASDVAPNFYIGVPGAVIEANLGPISSQVFDGYLGFPDQHAGDGSHTNGYATVPLSATMVEIGDGLRSLRNTETILLPTIHSRHRRETTLDAIDPMLRKKHRLDNSFHKIEDFGRAVAGDQELEGVAHLAQRLTLD